MIKSKLIIENHTRDFFREDYEDEFELVPLEGRSDVFEFKHDGCNVATLDKDQLKELVQYIQMAIL
jgi:hypothetical protein